MTASRCGMLHPQHEHLACSLGAGHSGGHRTVGATWPRRVPPPAPQTVAASAVEAGQRVRLRGITDRRAVSFTVELVEVHERSHVNLGGRDARGRWHFRTADPLARVEVLS